MTLPLKAVFLSYAHEDADTARRIAEALRGEGIEVWLDESALRGGEAWDASIRRQIRDCALFVPIISARTQARKEGYFRLEWKLADERSHLIAEGEPFVMPVVADGTKERDALVPKSFLNVQWSWLPHGEVPAAFVARVRAVLGMGDDPAVAAPAHSLTHSSGAREEKGKERVAKPDAAGWMRRQWPVMLPWMLVAIGVIYFAFRGHSPPAAPMVKSSPAPTVTRAVIALPNDAPLAPARVQPFGYPYPSIAISRDGTRLVYVALADETTCLYLRSRDDENAKPLPETRGAFHPFFSPDGRWVGFFAQGKVKKVSVMGGTPITLCDSGDEIHGGSWSEDGWIYFAPNWVLWRVAASGGAAMQLREGGNAIRATRPSALPQRAGLIGYFSAQPLTALSGDDLPIEVQTLAAGSRRRALERGHSPRWLPSGHLVFAQGNSLSAAAFDPTRSEPAGEPVPMVEGVMMDGLTSAAQYAVSDEGTLVYVAGGAQQRSTPCWVDRAGTVRALPFAAQTYGEFTLSPDGRRIALTVAPGNLWVFDVETGKGAPLPNPAQFVRWPLWTPDGRHVVFAASREGRRGIYRQPTDVNQAATLLFDDAGLIRPLPRDDKLLVVLSPKTLDRQPGDADGTAPKKAFLVRLDGKGQPEPVEGVAGGLFYDFSPDGRWLCFNSARSGRNELYVQRFPGGRQIQVSFDGGEESIWSPGGNEIFYRNRDAWMSVAVTTEPDFKAETPREMFRGSFLNPYGYSSAAAPDGQRFIMLKREQPDVPVTQLQLVLNWTEELKRRVPVRKNRAAEE